MLSLYALLVGVVLGLLLGLLRLANAALGNVEAILNLVLGIAGTAAEDYDHLETGQKQLPSASQLVSQVYDEVLLPSLETAVSEAFGVLAKPLLWAYRRTVGGAVRALLKWAHRRPLTAEAERQVEQAARLGLSTTAHYSAAVQTFAGSASELVSGVSRKIRRYAIGPLYIAFFGCLALAVIPLLILRLLTGGEAAG